MDARLPEYQTQTKDDDQRIFSDQKRGSLSPAQPLQVTTTSFKGCEKIPRDLSRNLCQLGINFYHLNLRQLYEKLKDEILFLGISSCLGFKKTVGWMEVGCCFLSFADGLSLLTGWWYSYGGEFEWQLFVHDTCL